MGDNFPGEITLYVPQGGLVDLEPEVPDAVAEHPAYRRTVAEGGAITLRDNQAPEGNPIPACCVTGDLVGIPDLVDYDFHSDAYLNKDAVVVYRREGSLEYFPSNQRGDILLTEKRVRRAIRGKDGPLGRDLLELFDIPEPSYEVGEHHFETGWEMRPSPGV